MPDNNLMSKNYRVSKIHEKIIQEIDEEEYGDEEDINYDPRHSVFHDKYGFLKKNLENEPII